MARSSHPAARPPRLPRRAVGGAALVFAFAIGAMLALGVGPFAHGPNIATAHAADDVPVTATDLIGRVANNSPQLAVDPTNARFMTMATRRDAPFDCALQVSGDGGASWLTVRPVSKLPSGASTCYAPEVAFDAHGDLYYLFVGLGAGNSPVGAYLTTSSDHAQHFSAPRQVLGAERYQVRIAIDQSIGTFGRLHLVWLEARSPTTSSGFGPGSNPIMTKYSDDGGYRFSSPLPISDTSGNHRVVAPSLALGPDHAVHVAYYDLGKDARDYEGLEGPTWSGRWTLLMATSKDGGARFGSPSVLDTDIAPPQRVMLIFTMPPPTVAADQSGRVFVAWTDARHGDWDVLLRRSVDDGQTWDTSVRLNDDALHDGRNQYMPQLSVAPSGRVDAVFYDRRSNVENRGNDVSYTFSTDGGRTFSHNLRINSLTFDSFIGPRYLVPSATGLREVGSRMALASQDSGVVAAWTDTRGTFLGGKAQDIFSARVTVDEPWWSMLTVPGGVLVLVALVAGALWAVGRDLLRHVLPRRASNSRLTGPAGFVRRRPASMGLAVCLAVVVAGATTVLVLSGRGTSSPRAPLPPSPPTVLVTMREYRFDFNAAEIHRGRVIFHVVNDGRLVHRLVLIPLPADLPPVEQEIHGSQHVIVQEAVAIRNLEPPGAGKQHGMSESFAFDLVPGRYAFVSYFVDPDGVSQAMKGMANEFSVQ